MGAQLRVVRRRIRSVQSTMKITRAMELIASSRIVKAQQRVEASRPYAVQLTRADGGPRARRRARSSTRCSRTRESPAKAGVLVVTSDRGLAGSYNSNVLKVAEQRDRRGARRAGSSRSLYVVGQEGRSATSGSAACRSAASWQGFSEVPRVREGRGDRPRADRGLRRRRDRRAAGARTRTSARRSRCARRSKRFLPIAPEEVDRRRRRRRRRPSTSSSPSPSRSWTTCCRSTSSRRSTRRCWNRRPRRTPRGGGR